MKFKEIKPGMVIHCPKEEDAEALLEHLERIGYNVGNYAKKRAFAEYGDQTCFYTNSSSRLFYYDRPRVSYGDIKFYTKDDDFKGITITEFSDLIEPEPRFNVGDKVRVKRIDEAKMKPTPITRIAKMYEGEAFTITSITECRDGTLYEGKKNPYKWPEEMLESVDDLPTDSPADSPIDSPIDSPVNSSMTAEEVLGWFSEADCHMLAEVFDGWRDVDDVLGQFEVKEIIAKITAYEAAKKAPKPVEVEWVDVLRIYKGFLEDDGELLVTFANYPPEPDTEKWAEEIVKEQDKRCDWPVYGVIERRCRVKEDES